MKCGESVDFYTMAASAARYGEIVVGYKKGRGRKNFDIILNPAKKDTVILSEEDALIVITEE